MNISEINSKINRLPGYAIPELNDYIDFLLSKQEKRQPKQPLHFKWEGGLAALKQEYNGVSLQKKALEWR